MGRQTDWSSIRVVAVQAWPTAVSEPSGAEMTSARPPEPRAEG